MEKNRIVAVTTFSILVIYIIFLLSTVSDLRSEISKEKNENVLLLSDKSDLENQIIKLKDDTQYKRDKDCREEANNLRKRWYNVQSGRYSEVFGECVVNYIDPVTKKLESGPISQMQDTK